MSQSVQDGIPPRTAGAFGGAARGGWTPDFFPLTPTLSLRERDWTLAEAMGAWLAFAWVSKRFSISHLAQIGFVGLSLQQPDQVASRGPCGLGIAPSRQTVKLLGAPIPENPDVAPE